MATKAELTLVGNLDQARAITDSVLGSEGFTVKYADQWTATAERGNAAATIAFGAFAGKKHQHIKIGVAYRSADAGRTILILSKLNSGAAAGVIGMSRATKAFDEAVANIRGAMASSGQLAG
ncbi:MAG: hypothetical protein FWF28_08435 [Micrococcales bacterium]|nr:hypothetical protein [Micrococcales bacterium]